jgi:excisionase family DNA binding protein
LTLSTNLGEEEQVSRDWVSQAEAARLHGVSRQAINKLVKNGRLRTLLVGGRVFVKRQDLEKFVPRPAGRPSVAIQREFGRIRTALDNLNPEVRHSALDHLLSTRSPHPVEVQLGAGWELILDAIQRSNELTVRMIRGVIAEAAFGVHVVKPLGFWDEVPFSGSRNVDYLLRDKVGEVKVQVKLQRSAKGEPVIHNGYYDVETQRPRGGTDRKSGTKTHPYRFGQFDILAVSLKPSIGQWDAFRYTVGDWLQPSTMDNECLAVHQPVSMTQNEDWTDDFMTCVGWLRGSLRKTIHGSLSAKRKP